MRDTEGDCRPPMAKPAHRARIASARTLAVTAAMATLLGGCAVVSVASTTVSLAATAASTAVDVGVGAVKVTGKVIGKGVDLVTGGPSAPSVPPRP